MENGKTIKLVNSGVSIALIILSLYGGIIIKNNKIAFLALATYFSSIPYIQGGIKYGVISYFASIALIFILIPNKLYSAAFFAFGIYPLIKLLTEQKKYVFELLLKLFWFNLTIVLYYLTLKDFIIINQVFLNNKLLIFVSIISLQLFFLVYDYIFSKFILFITDKIIGRR
ncbi:hypothetical protein Q428_04375 [Fervidicella metallireducens AeB]|uniref:DUF2232 domain-containing protein n=1 Tax=Fervidicella metallireducens AeB TaxID=1403537 RepID=A0A017RYU9_9CLOT|nr:hypothetical protein [Fervidicella metallireducens]EYE89090.1 hypothetical protein Q428_04375 [Fervidicella metallireducens AeB]